MSIVVKDETAGVVILTIDDSGNICFGDGTPISRLTLDGYGIIDGNGHIIHGGTSSTISYTSGTVNMAPVWNGSYGAANDVLVTTISGRTPTVQLDTQWPMFEMNVVSDAPPSDPTGTPTESYIEFTGAPQVSAYPYSSGFDLNNRNQYSNGGAYDLTVPGLEGNVFDPNDPYFDFQDSQLYVTYRWI